MGEQDAILQAQRAIAEIERRLALQSPWLARQAVDWIHGLSPTGRGADHFRDECGFPLLSLSRWMAAAVTPEPDLDFHADLDYSCVNGYLYIRLLDNLMDGHSPRERQLLPLTAFFHTEFQRIYQRYFEFHHPFWKCFESLWMKSSEAVLRETTLKEMDLELFYEVAANKLCAAKIPLTATGFHYGQSHSLPAWLRLCDQMSCCAQFADDLFDWHKDSRRGACTYFLSEADKRKGLDESRESWVVREGFEWGLHTLQGWLEDMRCHASQLKNPALDHYLDQSALALEQTGAKAASGLKSLAEVAAILAQG